MSPRFSLNRPQKFLGVKGLIFFIALMDTFIPLSTDMYLPALPTMGVHLGTSPSLVNLSVTAFFITYAVSLLLWGPLCDKYGRKPTLLAGIVIYLAASIGCAMAPNVYVLIIARLFHGLGAASVTAISMAMIKDCFSGQLREITLAIVQTLSGFGPMIAPVVGAWILRYFEWREIFWLLVIVSIAMLVLTLLYQESLEASERYTGNILGSLSRLSAVSKNPGFLLTTIIFALCMLPFMAYVVVSSYIYIAYFGLSEQSYSYFYAANALLSLAGPFIYIRFFAKANKFRFASVCFVICLASGVLVMTAGLFSPWLFLVSFLPFSLFSNILRPFSTNIILEQQQHDSGSASSMMNALFNGFGCIGMAIASISWSNLVLMLGAFLTAVSLLELIMWVWLMRSAVPVIGVKPGGQPVSEKA